MQTNQISVNNSTRYCYSKITQKSGIILGQIFRQIRGSDSTPLIFESPHCVRMVVFGQLRAGLVIVVRVITIFSYKYWGLTRLRPQNFDILLKNEPQVGTPICRNLKPTFLHNLWEGKWFILKIKNGKYFFNWCSKLGSHFFSARLPKRLYFLVLISSFPFLFGGC